MEEFTCSMCYKFTASNVGAVLRHIGTVHSHQADFRIVCGINGCPRTYTNYHSFRKHMHRKHSELPLQVTIRNEGETYHDDDGAFSFTSQEGVQSSSSWTKKHASLFVLKNKEVRQISQLHLNDLLADVSMVVQHAVDSLVSSISSVLDRNNIHVEDIDELGSVLVNEEIRNPFRGLESSYLQKNAYLSLGLVEPVERKLGTTLRRNHGKSRRRFRLVGECAYDVPLKESLQQLLSNDVLLEEVLQGHRRDDGYIGDYCDGSAFEKHPLFSTDPSALQIMLYFDEVEVCNPIGSRAKKHKLGAFYYLLGNFRPELRSSLKVIQLVTLVTNSLINEYGIDKILEPFMTSIKELESDEGMEIVVHGRSHNFRGSISLVCADNLASWNLGGYKALASALRKCRFCMAVAGDMQSKFLSEEFDLRTRDTHSNHCSQLSGPMREHVATTYGVYRDSILNTSKFFHVTEGLAPDIMHDVLEGALQYEMKELIKYIVLDQKLISLSALNHKIESFAYGPIEAPNRPVAITLTSLQSSDHSLKGTATQIWCLARMLPLLIGSCIPEGNPYWENFLLMLTITDIVFSPVISPDIISYLKFLILEHHTNFCILYPDAPIIPKLHYIIHLPEWLLAYGPASNYWCMRFEAKHGYFKSLAHKVKCFKNISKTLATRHQNQMCYFASSDVKFSKDWTFGRIRRSVLSKSYEHKCLLSGLPNLSDDTELHVMSWAKCGTTTYKPGYFVVLESTLLPLFGEIKHILVYGVDECVFVLQMYATQCFLAHYHSYEVTIDLSSFRACKPSQLVDYHALFLYTLPNGKKVIPLKYYLVENF